MSAEVNQTQQSQQIPPTNAIENAELSKIDKEILLAERCEDITYQSHGCIVDRKSTQTSAGLTRYTVTRVSSRADVELLHDQRFSRYGIEADGILINQAETLALWNRFKPCPTVGLTPEEFLKQSPQGDAVAHYTNHFGWQYGEALIIKERVLTLPGDDLLPVVTSAICLTKNGWEHQTLELDGTSTVMNVKLGFTLPMIVKNAHPIPISDLLGLPRFMADPRNGINFTPGGVDGKFFPPFREGPLMLIKEDEYKRLYNGETMTLRGQTKLTAEGLKVMKAAMTDEVKKYIDVSLKAGETIFKIKEALPMQSIPAFIIGISRSRELVTIAVDGRQQGLSAGATFTELQKIALDEGLVFAGFGPAGNDVVTAVRSGGDYWYASSPAAGSSRPLPAVLKISAAKA